MSSTIKQRLRRYNGIDYDNIYLSANVGDVVGTLPVANGGTGRSTLTSGYFLRGNGTSAITMSSAATARSAMGLGNSTSVLGTSYGGTGNSSVDTAPTANSTRMVTSSGIYTALSNKADSNSLVSHTENGDIHVTSTQKSTWNSKQNALTFDTKPTSGSANPVTSGGVYDALQHRSNPNLLDNWYFVGGGSQQGGGQFPINQRRQTSYTDDRAYTIDRWRFGHWQAVSPAVTIGNDGLTISSGTNVSTPNSCHVVEILENGNIFCGKTMTVSILVSSTSSTYSVGVFNSAGDTEYTRMLVNSAGLATQTFTVPSNASGLQVWIGHSGSFGGIGPINTTVKAVKLELGDTQTLAYQDENGNWVLNEIPNFQQELTKCQRFFWRFHVPIYRGFAIGQGMDSHYVRVPITTPVEMRAIPSVTIVDGEIGVSNSTGATYALTTSAEWEYLNGFSIKLYREDVTFNGSYIAQALGSNGVTLDVSADL